MSLVFDGLLTELSQLPEISAIALGGSRAGNDFDDKSDYDLYLYVNALPTEETRKNILSKFCKYIEIGNSFWELEDDCTLNDGIDIDILYRNINDFAEGIKRVVEDSQAGTGYTTAMWHNLVNSKILCDKKCELTKLQQKYNISYPNALKQNLIKKNLPLLEGMLPSYDKQIKKSFARKDFVAVNHRIAAFFESYFEIIFAVNELTHPGEKRQVSFALKNAKILPKNFEENINKLFSSLFSDDTNTLGIINEMVCEIKKIAPIY